MACGFFRGKRYRTIALQLIVISKKRPLARQRVQSMSLIELFYSDVFELPLPEGHRFPMSKYRLLRERIAVAAWCDHVRFNLPPAASDDQLALAHCREYLRRVVAGELTELEIKRIGFPWSPQMVERSRRSTGASIEAGRSAVQQGLAANLAGGTHHAGHAAGQGFCVFNDACVAARVLQSEALVRRVLICDCDVHQGNGSAEIAQHDPSIYTLSIHCNRNYPFRKATSDLDIELPPGTGDEVYLASLALALETAWAEFKPDLVFYLAGADPYEGDRLGQFSLTKWGLRRRDQLVLDWFRDRGFAVSLAMAGGYAPDCRDIVDIHFATVEAAQERFLAERATSY